jgi:hypothetical protein
MERGLGYRKPPDRRHEELYSIRAVLPTPVATVERVLALPRWHWTHDQGGEGSCVGHGAAMERAVTNTAQNRLLRLVWPTRRYDPIDLWNTAKVVDGDPDTNPGDDNGTYVRAAYDVLRDRGARRVRSMRLTDGVPVPVGARDVDAAEGVAATRWARTTDEMRSAVAAGLPVTIGVDWYTGFDEPTQRTFSHGGFEWWLPDVDHLGSVRGGHCICVYGASDRRQAFKVKNSWGRGYPLVWLPYATMTKLLDDDGEAALTTDR